MGNTFGSTQNYSFSRSTSAVQVLNTTSNNGEEDQEIRPANATTQPTQSPPSNLYFGSPISWLLGGSSRPDLAYLTSLGRNTPQVHQTTAVKCPVNINKNSLQLIPVDESKFKYRVQFIFDSTEPCLVKILYAITESISATGEPSFLPERDLTFLSFEKGLGQLYNQPPLEYLDVSGFKEEEINYNPEQNYYPIVIIIQTDASKVKVDPKVKIATSQLIYCALIKCADSTFVIKPIKQKIRYDGKTYVIHEIFGLENNDTEAGRECVICMTEPRDTTVLPCRHMCLCSSCADVLRHQSNKCPICRSTVRSLIEVKITKPQEEETESEDSEVEETLVLKKDKKTSEGKQEVPEHSNVIVEEAKNEESS